MLLLSVKLIPFDNDCSFPSFSQSTDFFGHRVSSSTPSGAYFTEVEWLNPEL